MGLSASAFSAARTASHDEPAGGGGPERTVADQMRFDGFGWALVECFLVFAGEGWSERMYAAMRGADPGAPAPRRARGGSVRRMGGVNRGARAPRIVLIGV